jgi:DNA-binding transcriptional LysR family regulator
MDSLDMNLLRALDALLTDNSVTAAADRLHTSPPAMSRSLARLRRLLGDPLLVRAGREMVPTQRALELRGEVRDVVDRAKAVFGASPATDPATAVRTFALRVSDLFSTGLIAQLITQIQTQAPGITLRFRPEGMDDTPALRDGLIDLEVGVLGDSEPEVLTETLFSETIVGVVRPEHPLANRKKVTAQQFARSDHVAVSRRGRTRGPVDDRLHDLGLTRRVVAVVPTYASSLFLARETDVVCLAPSHTGHDALQALGLRTFALPVSLPTAVIAMAWHPRNDSDRIHQWLRGCIRQIVHS